MNNHHNLALVLAATLGAAGVAQAQVALDVQATQTASSFIYLNPNPGNNTIFSQSGPVSNGAAQFSDGNGVGTSATGSYANFQNVVNQTLDEIQFANNATARNDFSLATSTSTVNISVTNTGGGTLNASLNSQILPGGFGLYMDNPLGNPTFSNGLAGNINESPQSLTATFANTSQAFGPSNVFNTLSNTGELVSLTTPPGDDIGLVSFDFNILVNGVSVTDYNGVLELTTMGHILTLNAAAQTLANFHAIPNGLPLSFVGFGWDATDVPTIQLGALASGATATISYVTTVTAQVNAIDLYDYLSAPGATQNQTTSPGLLAYSGFGDPVAKTSGGKGVADPNFALLNLGQITYANGSISGGDLKSYSPSSPLLNIDTQSLDAVAPFYAPPVAPRAAVPEPQTWALMLAGFGLAGAALRRRRNAAAR